MTAASGHAPPDRERAETYLRLQAEAELRRALAMPRFEPPRQPLPARLISYPRRMRRRRAMVSRNMRQQAGQRQPGPLGRQLRQSANAAGYRLHQVRGTARRLSWLFLNRLCLLNRLRGRRHQGPAAQACLSRVSTLAGVLAAVGAISEQTEAEVVDNFAAALAARGRIEPHAVLGARGISRHRMRRPVTTPPVPASPPRAHPVGKSANGEVEGVPVRFHLGILVIDQGGVTLTVRARLPARLMEQHDANRMHLMLGALSETSAADDRGSSHRVHFAGGWGDGGLDGRLQLSPAPPAGVRWLDVTLPGAGVVRVPMDAPAADLRVTTARVTTTAADRFLDAQTAELLLAPADDAAQMLGCEDASVFGIATDLLAAGVLSTSSESLRRLSAVAAHLGVRLPGSLTAIRPAIQPAGLPAGWLSLMARAGQPGVSSAPAGVIPVAAVLPEVDGARCVIGELISDAGSATLQVHAHGWPEPRLGGRARTGQFCWSASDDLGGWYLLEDGRWSQGNGETDLELRFRPAISSRARALDISLTGPTTQATVTVPLDWQEGP